MHRPLRIRIEGPSSPFAPERLHAGVVALEMAGHIVDVSHGGPRGSHAYLNGDDAVRRASLEEALHDDDVDVVWLARGGYGLTRIVDTLTLPERMPLVVGFSDATALFGRLARDGYDTRCIHGPLATTLSTEPAESFDHLMGLLHGEGRRSFAVHTVRPSSAADADVDADADADVNAVGPLFVANLVVLAAMVGTPSMPSLRGKVVVLEEVGERPYRIDRLLTQLVQAGCFDGVAAVVVGHLTGCDDPPPSPGHPRDPAPAARAVFVERLAAAGIPVAFGVPVGHEAPNFALPLGWTAQLRIAGGVGHLSLPLMPEHWPPACPRAARLVDAQL